MTIAEANILVVDDEPVLRLTFSILLKQTGAVVHTAANGLEALHVLEHEVIDVMLTDKQMPEMDGITLLNTLLSRGIRVPTIFFVNGVASENPREMERLGVVETATKPLHPKDLVTAITRVLSSLKRHA